ncbi:MAG: hypothetical protein ABSA47_18140 [Verrucomicrobiota bacterium]
MPTPDNPAELRAAYERLQLLYQVSNVIHSSRPHQPHHRPSGN